MSFKQYFDQTQAHTNELLATQLPSAKTPISTLRKAMRYSLLAGGKRVRPLLLYATADAFGLSRDNVDKLAIAVEMVHTFSLIHDDLPAMDDDDLRRGKPTCHVEFDEATAILAGDALHTEAFDILARTDFKAETIVKMIQTLARSIGQSGMVQGQTIDVQAVGKTLSIDELKKMHYLKTGCLIEASVILGYLATEQPNDEIEFQLRRYAQAIGLAFQIQDDILDASASSDILGKTAGKDADDNKPNFVDLLGLEGSKQIANELLQEAHDALQSNAQLANSHLYGLAQYIVKRNT